MKIVGTVIAFFLAFQASILAQSTKVDTHEYEPRPGQEILDLEKLLTLSSVVPSRSYGGQISDMIRDTPIIAHVRQGRSFLYCYPENEDSYCGWLVSFIVDNSARSDDARINISLPENIVYVFDRDGRILSWSGAFLDDNEFGHPNLVDRAFSSTRFINDKTKKVVEVSLGLSDKFKGWRRTLIYDANTYQYGFFLRLALERAGFHRMDYNVAPANYFLSVDMQNVNVGAFGWSFPTKITSSIVIKRGASSLSETKIEGKGVSKHNAAMPEVRGANAMSAAMADSAVQIVKELEKQIGSDTP